MSPAAGAARDDGPGVVERAAAALVYYVPSLLVILALLVLWQVAVMALGVKEYILPSPIAALRALANPNYQ